MDVLYWECSCGSRCFFDLNVKTNHKDTCPKREKEAFTINEVIEICTTCERDKLRELAKKKYILIEKRLLLCHLTNFTKSHVFLLLVRRNLGCPQNYHRSAVYKEKLIISAN